MAILGTNAGTSLDDWPADYTLVSGPYTASENGTITKVTVKYDATTLIASFDVRALVYLDSSGAPAGLKLYTDLVTIPSGAAAAEYDFSTLHGTATFANGDKLWIGQVSNTPGVTPPKIPYTSQSGGARYQYSPGSGASPTDPFPGSPITANEFIWAYVTYTPSGGAGPVNTVAPAVTGTPRQGQTLSCTSGTWT